MYFTPMKTSLLFFYLILTAAVFPVTVGVLPFANNSLADRESLMPLTRGLPDMMATALSKVKGVTLVERAKLEQVMAEIRLSQEGVVDEASAKEAGKMLGAELLLLGGFTAMPGGDLRIDVRLVKVETGETVKAEEATGTLKKVLKLMRKLEFKMAEGLTGKLSKEDKKAMEAADTEDYDTFMKRLGIANR